MRLAKALGTSVTSWRDVHAALVPFNEADKAKEAGLLFEEFAKYFFLTAPERRDTFKNVWAEAEIPTRIRKKLTLASRDHGVDLLLEDHEGRFHAVQCKFKTDESKILGWTKDRLSSWLAESDEAQGLVMFTNASGIDPQSTRKAEKKDFSLITVGNLVSLSPETIQNIARLARGRAPKKAKRFKPRPYQRKAINDVVKGFKTHDRGQLILPCGAGKTLTALWLKERMGVKRTLVLVPSLALLRQMRQEWAAQQKERLPYLCVCSEKDIDKDKRDAIVTHTFEVPGHVTTQPDEIRAFARKHRELVAYSTYQSLQAVVDAGVKFDLAICDEAHKTATARHNEFALVHTKELKVRKRLYMTATPRVLSPQAKGKLGEDPFQVVADMSDEETFGPEFHRMTFADAIEQGILVDYKIVVVGVSDQEVHRHIEKRTYLEDASADQVATSLALAKVMKKHGLAHGLTFHSNVKRAKLFTELHKKRTRRTNVEHVNGSMSTNDRLVLLDEFKEAPRAVMTNARCLTEGVDVPAIDCIAFVDPKHSKVDIVQAAGRALRLPRGDDEKPYGVILIPIFYEVGEDPEAVAESGIFRNVFEVVRAMADQDERLQAEIMNIKFGEGQKAVAKPRVIIDTGGERVVFSGFEEQLKEALVERVFDRTVGSWDYRFAQLEAFYRKYGHHDIPGGDENAPLRKWTSVQRLWRKQGHLSPARIARLDAIAFPWTYFPSRADRVDSLRAWIDEHGRLPRRASVQGNWLAKLRRYYWEGELEAEHVEVLEARGVSWKTKDEEWEEDLAWLRSQVVDGVCNPPAKARDSLVAKLRQEYRRGRLPKERVRALNEIGFVWSYIELRWRRGFEKLLAFKAKHGRWPKQRECAAGAWAYNQRNAYRLGQLSAERVRKLEKLGFDWNPTQEFHRGERNPLSKLSDKQVAAIYRSKKSKEALAAEYGVTHWTIQDIWHGKSRTDITDKLPPRKVKRHLTPEQVLEIYRADGTQQEIADRFGMSRANVSLIKSGKQWAHVTGHKARVKK